MNREKWVRHNHSVLTWATKLSEECGEVSRATLDYTILDNPAGLKTIIEECKHVEFIARRYRIQLERKTQDA